MRRKGRADEDVEWMWMQMQMGVCRLFRGGGRKEVGASG